MLFLHFRHVCFKNGIGQAISQTMMISNVKMIGNKPVMRALKYSVVPVSFTMPKSITKQSTERKTFADSPTVFTPSNAV
jgi:hypothetical protein